MSQESKTIEGMCSSPPISSVLLFLFFVYPKQSEFQKWYLLNNVVVKTWLKWLFVGLSFLPIWNLKR